MNYFLIDYENVKVSGFDGVSKLNENDYVIVFYSENAETLTFGLHRRINESKAKFQFQKVAVKEKNALDFQLCAYLGFLVSDTMTYGEDEKNFYYIVSNDKGYSVLPEYMKKFGADVKIVSNLSKNIVTPVAPLQYTGIEQEGEGLETTLSKILKMNDVSEFVTAINNCKTNIEVNNYLCKKFGSQKGGEIYRTIKQYLSV